MKVTHGTISTIVTSVAVLILVAALPSAIHDTIETGRVYLISRQFLEEMPQRFTGPGRFRFVLQALVAILFGCRSGLADARMGLPPYLYGLLMDDQHRKELIRSGWSAIRNLVAMGIVLDAVAQLLIYQQGHPGAALLVGPTLICIPYAVSRAVTNRVARRMLSRSGM